MWIDNLSFVSLARDTIISMVSDTIHWNKSRSKFVCCFKYCYHGRFRTSFTGYELWCILSIFIGAILALLVHNKNCHPQFSVSMRLDTQAHTEKSFRNLIKSNRNQIVFTIFRLIRHQTDVRLVSNLSENGNYNLISVWFNKISLCVSKRMDLPAWLLP